MTVSPIAPIVPGSRPRRSESLLGLALMAGGMFIFSAVDTQAKFLTQTLPSVQIVWCRQLGLLIGVIVLIAMRGTSVLHTKQPVLQITRGGLAAGSALLFIIAVSYVPLADAVAVSFIAPFVVTVLGALILGERVGLRRWAAVTIGFLGSMIVIRPGLGALHPAVMLVVVAAILFALRQILSRALADTDRTSTTIAYTALVGSFLLTLPLPFIWQWPGSTFEILLLTSIAVMAAGAEILVIKALEVAQAVVVAPVQYSLIIWGTAYGYFVFGQFPDMWTWIGAVIIIASGLYTLQRDAKASTTRVATDE
ncbi:MAG: DMT family transporter [Rhizobiaceae bacterium]